MFQDLQHYFNILLPPPFPPDVEDVVGVAGPRRVPVDVHVGAVSDREDV